jgi:DNA-binding MarR family transcriptional regulator
MAEGRDVVAGIIQLANLMIRRLGPVFEKSGVTPQQWAVLAAMAAEGPIAPVALARRLGVTKQNMTGMIARLEQLEFVERQVDESDLRSFRIQLTRRGRNLAERLRGPYLQWIASLSDDEAGARDLQTLTRTVERLIARLEAESP